MITEKRGIMGAFKVGKRGMLKGGRTFSVLFDRVNSVRISRQENHAPAGFIS